MSGDVLIVHVAAGQKVDTGHILDLAAAVGAAAWYAGEAAIDLGQALALAPTQAIGGLAHVSDVTGDIWALLFGGTSVRSFVTELNDLARALTWTAATYAEAEQRATAAVNSVPPGLVAATLPPTARLAMGLGALVVAFAADRMQLIPRSVAIQSGARTAIIAWDPGSLLQRYHTMDGPVAARDLTPVQRAAYILMHTGGIDRFDGDVRMRELDGSTFQIGGPDPRVVPRDFDTLLTTGAAPPATVAALGATYGFSALTGPPTWTGSRTTARLPASAAGRSYLPRTIEDLNHRGAAAQEQIIRVDRIEKANGTLQWLVFAPGTTAGSALFNKNPANHDGNVTLVAGLAADASRSVQLAMRSAGVKRGDNVAIVGHSQGGIVAQSFASSKKMQAEYNINHVVTFGAPTGGFVLPATTKSLHLEEIRDFIPALDGAANTARPGQVSVLFSAGELGVDGGAWTHSMDTYEKGFAAFVASSNPDLIAARSDLDATLGFDQGARVTSREFSAVRGVHGAAAIDQVLRTAIENARSDGVARIPGLAR